jgi:PAS domain S-box-containing protein
MVFVIMGSQLDKAYQAWKQVWNKPEAFRTLVEKSVSGILLVNDKYAIEYVNESVCTILGCTREELLSHDFRNFLHPDTRDMVVERYSRMVDGNKISACYEMKIVRSDAEVRDLERFAVE